jgi:hypothetical protein
LPENIRAGYTLRDEDVDAVRSLLIRRDTQIRYLYEREKEFSDVVHGILRSRTFRLFRMLTWPARKCWGWIKTRPSA